jgi:ribosomal protein L40E
MLWLVDAIMVVVGLALLLAGLRGRRTDDHPICRRCRFDLVGLPESAEVCPECGSSLDRPKAVRVGHRRKRRGLIALGVVATLSGATLFGLFSWQTLAGSPTQLPAWVLEAEARWAGGQTSLDAWDELALRVKAGTLGKSRSLRMVDVALARQKPPALGWKRLHGDYIDAVNAAGLLDDMRLATYLRQGVTPTIRVRRVVRAGEPIPLGLGVSSIRLGKQGVVCIRKQAVSIELPGTEFHGGRVLDGHDTMYTGQWRSSGMSLSAFPLHANQFQTQPGEHTMRVVMRYEVYTDWSRKGGKPLAGWEQAFELPIRVVPSNEQTVELIEPTPESRREMLEAISIDGIKTSAEPGQFSYVRILTSGPAEDFAFDVYLEADGERWHIGSLCRHSGSGIITFGLGAIWPESVDPKKVDVVFEPSVGAAEESLDVFRIWNGTIRIKDVPVMEVPVVSEEGEGSCSGTG